MSSSSSRRRWGHLSACREGGEGLWVSMRVGALYVCVIRMGTFAHSQRRLSPPLTHQHDANTDTHTHARTHARTHACTHTGAGGFRVGGRAARRGRAPAGLVAIGWRCRCVPSNCPRCCRVATGVTASCIGYACGRIERVARPGGRRSRNGCGRRQAVVSAGGVGRWHAEGVGVV